MMQREVQQSITVITSQATDNLANTTDSPNSSRNDSAVSEYTDSRAPDRSDRRDPRLTFERVPCLKKIPWQVVVQGKMEECKETGMD